MTSDRFCDGYIAIFLEKRKTISTEKDFCFRNQFKILPCGLLKKFFCKGVHFSDSYLFRKVVNTGSGFRFRDQKLSYSHALELLRNVLQAIHLDDKKYGLHSLRSGDASLAEALGVPDRLIMRQGSWRSVSSKNRYIRESKAPSLEVSRAFNL